MDKQRMDENKNRRSKNVDLWKRLWALIQKKQG